MGPVFLYNVVTEGGDGQTGQFEMLHAEGDDGQAGQFEVLQSERDADNGDAEEYPEKEMG